MFPSPFSLLVGFARPSRASLCASLCAWFAVSGMLAPPPVLAQTPSPKSAPPAPPTLVGPAWKKPELPCTWKVQVSNLSTQAGIPLAKGSAEAMPSSYSIHSGKDLTIARFQYPGGQSKETWIFPLRSFVQLGSGEPTLAPSVGGEEEGWASLQELAWIRPDLYLGEFPLEGETCLVFAILPAPPSAPAPPAGQGGQGGARPTSPQTATPSASARTTKAAPQGPIAGLPLQPGVQAAAISERTRMPKLLQEGVLIRKYEFGTPSKEDFVVPEKISKLHALWAPKKPLPPRTP